MDIDAFQSTPTKFIGPFSHSYRLWSLFRRDTPDIPSTLVSCSVTISPIRLPRFLAYFLPIPAFNSALTPPTIGAFLNLVSDVSYILHCAAIIPFSLLDHRLVERFLGF